MANETVDKDDRIKALEGLLKAAKDASSVQAKTHDQLMQDFRSVTADLKAANEKHSFQKKRADRLEAALKSLSAPSKGTIVTIDGALYESIGDFRADSTFVEVKRGHCPEGVTLIAINKQH